MTGPTCTATGCTKPLDRRGRNVSGLCQRHALDLGSTPAARAKRSESMRRYSHNNCGGFCCKAGQAHYANRFRVQPERFAYDAMMERKLRAYLGDYAMLTDRRGGDKKPMSLDAFAKRLIEDPTTTFEVLPGESGCGCMGVAA